MIILLALILVNLMLWRFAMPRYVKHRIARFQDELVNRHYDEVETMYRTMRGWRHDYHNHIQTLAAYMSMGQYEEASGYLELLAEDLAKVDTLLRTGNVMVDAILNSKLTLMRERQIRVDATAAVPGKIAVPDIELSVLIGNLLDNAMEACMKLPEEERFIRIYIDVIKKQLYICVTNSMDRGASRRISQPKGRRRGVCDGGDAAAGSWVILSGIWVPECTCMRRRNCLRVYICLQQC